MCPLFGSSTVCSCKIYTTNCAGVNVANTVLHVQVESGGTVLSTNWGEVGEKEVERKPPDGMEWKKYEV